MRELLCEGRLKLHPRQLSIRREAVAHHRAPRVALVEAEIAIVLVELIDVGRNQVVVPRQVRERLIPDMLDIATHHGVEHEAQVMDALGMQHAHEHA
eukprot:scaffold58698_cov70-Phaeocystis_antarctica.AAC.5